MMCTPPCSFQFCWICTSPWRDDDGRCLRCEKYKEVQSKRKEKGRSGRYKIHWDSNEVRGDTRRKRAKRYRERYIHCYERGDSNQKLRKRAMVDLERARIGGLMQIVECRHVLKWSYVYGYYLAEEGGKATFLEHLQAQAEAALERLHHCVDKESGEEGREGLYAEEFRHKVLCLISATRKYFEYLVRAMENDLAEVENYLVMDEQVENLVMALEKNDIADEEDLVMALEKNIDIAEVENYLAKEIEDFVIASEKNEIAQVENYLAKEIEDLVMALERKERADEVGSSAPILVKEKEKPAKRSSMNGKLKSE